MGSDNPPLAELLELDDAAFRARFRGTPIKRTGRDRFLRNVLIAAGNSGDAALVPEVETRLGDASPLVRAMAVWALSRLAPECGGGASAKRRHQRKAIPPSPTNGRGLAREAFLLRPRLFGARRWRGALPPRAGSIAGTARDRR